MLPLILLINIILLYIYYFRDSFIAELIVSFFPYIIAFIFIVILFLFVKITRLNNKNKRYRATSIIFIFLLLLLSFWNEYLYSTEYFWFYNKISQDIRLQENQKWIKVFYANILYKNTDYNSLKNKIEKENPDIVILVEFSDEHEDEMKEFFKADYQYMNRNSWSSMLAGDVVFSKIPLENITETHIVNPWERNYSYMKILCDNCWSWVDLYVIHTAAPVSTKNLEMRNIQLNKLKSDFIKNNSEDEVMIIWDFNLSPWSFHYKQLTKDWNLNNALSYQNPNYTRSLFQHKIFRSHIDQLFFSPWIKISEIDVEDLVGSDHRSFTFYFWL